MQLWNWEFRKNLSKYIYSDPAIFEEVAEMIIGEFKSAYTVTDSKVDHDWNSIHITLESEDRFDSECLMSAACKGIYHFLDANRSMIIEKIGEEAKQGLDCALSSSAHASLMFDLTGYPGRGSKRNEKSVSINL